MSTYPSGPVLPAGLTSLAQGIDPNVWVTSPDGNSKFWVLGGAAPWAGIQDGVICTQWPRGLTPSFKHLDQQGSHQDGTTWVDTVYDPMQLNLPLEAHANTAQGVSQVVSEWIGAWDPKKPTTLEYWTLDRGYWYCNPRLDKVWADQIKQSPRRRWFSPLTHYAREDQSFWRSIDSTSVFHGRNEVQTITLSGNLLGTTFRISFRGDTTAPLGTNSTATDILHALQSLGTIGANNVTVSGVQGGPYVITFQGALAQVAVDLLTTSVASGLLATVFRVTVGGTTSGYLPLSNIGDQDGWPRYLLYAGSGSPTFALGNGPGSSTMITFGPMTPGQIVLLTTEPRLRSVVDLTPAQVQTLNAPQQFLQQLISLVTNNNTPPLLQWFESLFGIQPPQGNLYALLNGRFDTPIPGVPQPRFATTQHIACSITNGSSDSKIVAALTPQRRWPE